MQGIKDDVVLFREMMADYKAKQPFQADAFWKGYERGNVRYIENFGLRDFFQKPSSFGARSLRKNYLPTLAGQCFGVLINALSKRALLPDTDWRNSHLNYFKFAKDDSKAIRQTYGNVLHTVLRNLPGGTRIDTLVDDLAGNPSEVISIGKKKFSLAFLEYFWRILFMQNLVPLDNAHYVYEIGMGYGGFADVLLKMYPDICICLTDIPPQLYIAEQYLKSVFPGKVLGYLETRDRVVIDRDTFGPHRVVIVPPWDVAKIAPDTFDGFTNQNSFQEMSPATCQRYCAEIQPLIRDWIFLLEQRQGCGGVKEPVTRDHYMDFFKPFRLMNEVNIIKSTRKDGTPVHGDAYVFRRA